jgi:ribosome-associated translation inhibitor RaiA
MGGCQMTLNLSLNFDGKLKHLNFEDREQIISGIGNQLEKMNKFGNSVDARVSLRQFSRRTLRDLPMISASVTVYTRLGKFIAKGFEYGIDSSVNKAVKKIETQIMKVKSKSLGI